MAFLVSNFIRNYTSTAKVLEIQNSTNAKVFTLSVCNYQKSFVDNNKLVIILQDNNIDKKYIIEFANNSTATSAQLSFKNAINALKINCQQVNLTPPSPSQTPIPITYLEYKDEQQNGTLFVAQWYDVSDTTNLLGLGGGILRLLAKTINDYEPSGIVLGTNQLVTITTLDDTIQRFEEGLKKILGLNNSKITYDVTSSKLTATTGSILTAVACTNIEVNNRSTATLNNCNYVTISNNSNVIINNASQVIINGIQQDLTILGFNLQNVKIDLSDSIGKIGKDVKINPISLDLDSYNDLTDQELRFNTNDNTIDIILDNKIVNANGEFRILYSGAGINNIINIRDLDNNLLYELNDTIKESWAIFRFNKTTELFEFINLDFTKNVSHIVYQVNVASDGDTNFALPSPATDALKLQMIINGQDQLFGPDFTYSSPGNVIFQNRNFTLQAGDEIKFLIF